MNQRIFTMCSRINGRLFLTSDSVIDSTQSTAANLPVAVALPENGRLTIAVPGPPFM